MNGQEEVWERGVGLVRRGGGDEVEGVGGAPDSNVFDLSRKMYFTKRTVDRAKVTICGGDGMRGHAMYHNIRSYLISRQIECLPQNVVL